MSYESFLERINSGELIILDGGTGTELQKRGVAMAPGAWCGPVSLENRSVLEEVHLDYIRAGAEIITANTYSSSRIMLREAGYENQFVEINNAAIDAALTARERSREKTVLVAGSLSHMIPIKPRTDTAADNKPSTAFMKEAFEELALLFKELGCDLILLEMMYHPERIPPALAAGRSAGLPLWAGFSIGQDEEGNPSVYKDSGCSIDEMFRCIDPDTVDVMGLMHSGAPLTGPGLEILRRYWSGPLSAYPDSGYFTMPDWNFERILSPQEFLEYSRSWFKSGVRILGGCCGLGPEHISVIQELKSQ